MLHVNEHGRVTHAKLLNSPGLELDAIALRQAFDLEFEPARDRSRRPMRSLISGRRTGGCAKASICSRAYPTPQRR
jgi:hypothetical protein